MCGKMPKSQNLELNTKQKRLLLKRLEHEPDVQLCQHNGYCNKKKYRGADNKIQLVVFFLKVPRYKIFLNLRIVKVSIKSNQNVQKSCCVNHIYPSGYHYNCHVPNCITILKNPFLFRCSVPIKSAFTGRNQHPRIRMNWCTGQRPKPTLDICCGTARRDTTITIDVPEVAKQKLVMYVSIFCTPKSIVPPSKE